MNDAGLARAADKVIVLRGDFAGSRGVVVELRGSIVVVTLESGTLEVPVIDIHNYSAAARKAWQTMPDRKVGRPKDNSRNRKRMVSLRVDSFVWDELGKAVVDGLIESRELAVNVWLREKLNELRRQQSDTISDESKGAASTN